MARRLRAPARSFVWVASTQSVVAPQRETMSRGASVEACGSYAPHACQLVGRSLYPLQKRICGFTILSKPPLWKRPSLETVCR